MKRKNQLKLVLNGLLVALCLFAAGCENQIKQRVLDAEPVSLISDERTLFINYWAVWCTPCIEEMPILAEFREANLSRVDVYGVNFDNPTEDQLREDVKKLDVRIPNLLDDPAHLFGIESPQVLPTTLVIRDGQVVDTLIGPQTMQSLLAAL